MAAPTDVRVEATGSGAVRIKWVYTGASAIEISRSLIASTTGYAVVATVSAGAGVFNQTGLTPAVFYRYKLSDDSGITFSSVVAVEAPAECGVVPATPGFPYAGNTVAPQDFNQLTALVNERRIRNESRPPCIACVNANGAVIIDCSGGCIRFQVLADQNINSISFINCGGLPCPDVDFIIPASTTVEICGWPAGYCNFSRDECRDAPLTGPARMNSNGLSVPNVGPPGFQVLPCPCPIAAIALQIVCCTDLGTGNCDLVCDEDRVVVVRACGGYPPYTWTKTGKGITLDPTTGPIVKLSGRLQGSNIDGVAYIKYQMKSVTVGVFIGAGPCPDDCNIAAGWTTSFGNTPNGNAVMRVDHEQYGCRDTLKAAGQCTGSNPAEILACEQFQDGRGTDVCLDAGSYAHDETCVSGSTNQSKVMSVSCNGYIDSIVAADAGGSFLCADGVFGTQTTIDTRTQQMIDKGCAPCELGGEGSVTVTDAFGQFLTFVF